MTDAGYGQERSVGRVVAVSNYRVNVQLDPDTRSQVRSFPRSIAVITQIGGYLLFPVSPGVLAVGIIVGASEDEALEPDANGFMTLQLARARRILRLNLLGQLKLGESFGPGVSIYPTLDTPALLPTDDELTHILQFRPPPSEAERDVQLTAGLSPIYGQQPVIASYNDLLARPLGVVGNTGSGKSCSVARLIKEALHPSIDKPKPSRAKFIILDINGEYGKAFGVVQSDVKEVNTVYINGKRFVFPLWAFTLPEYIAFFEASQASQVPVLERVITEIRENAIDRTGASKQSRRVVRLIDSCNSIVDNMFLVLAAPTGPFCGDKLQQLGGHLRATLNNIVAVPLHAGYVYPVAAFSTTVIDQQLKTCPQHHISPAVVANVEPILEQMRSALNQVRADALTGGSLREVTADSPIPYEGKSLLVDEFYLSATSRFRSQERMQEYLSTLRLRIHRQLTDQRWAVFTDPTAPVDLADFVAGLLPEDDQVVVVDCSMLAHDVLPCFCGVFGRVLLDLRSRAEPNRRTQQPFVLVLEEAHNYLRPQRQEELWGIRLSRDAFERISKEGRKFGLSIVIASQRPSDVSATVLSQCANFLIHRIQNPEDIDYFKKILPLGSRDLLEQLPILAPGEGLLMGSAVNVPIRVKVVKPHPSPESETPRPWEAWQDERPAFDVVEALSRWGAGAIISPVLVEEQPSAFKEDCPCDGCLSGEEDLPF